MKTIEEVLVFCNEFTNFNLYTFEKVIELNQKHDCIINLSSKCDHVNEIFYIRVLDVRDDKSLKVIAGNAGETVTKKIKIWVFTIVILRDIV